MRAPPRARGPCARRPSARRSPSRARPSASGSVAGVSRAEPVRTFRPRSVRSSTAWPSEPRRIGSGSGSTGPGRRTCSISQRTGHPAKASRPRADSRSRAASSRQHLQASTGGAERGGSGALARGRPRATQLVRGRRLGRRPGDLGEQTPPAAGPQLVGEQRADVVEERRRLLRTALLVRAAERQEQHLLRARDAARRTASARARACPRGAASTSPEATASAARAPSSRNGSGCGRRGSSPSCRPHTKTARKRRARIASGSASSTPGAPSATGSGPSRTSTAASASSSSAGPPASAGSASASRVSSPTAPRSSAAARASASASGASTSARRTCGRGPDRFGLGEQRREERPAVGRGRGERVELGEVGPPRRSQSRRASRAVRCPSRRTATSSRSASAAPQLRRVTDPLRSVPSLAGAAASLPGVRSQVTTSCAVPDRGAQRGQRPAGPSRAASGERRAALAGDRDAVAAEHLGEEVGGEAAADEHRDVLARHPVAQQLEHGRADQLGLGALAAGLEQPDGAVGRDACRFGLEQPPLEVVQRAAARWRRSAPSAPRARRARAPAA